MDADGHEVGPDDVEAPPERPPRFLDEVPLIALKVIRGRGSGEPDPGLRDGGVIRGPLEEPAGDEGHEGVPALVAFLRSRQVEILLDLEALEEDLREEGSEVDAKVNQLRVPRVVHHEVVEGLRRLREHVLGAEDLDVMPLVGVVGLDAACEALDHLGP